MVTGKVGKPVMLVPVLLKSNPERQESRFSLPLWRLVTGRRVGRRTAFSPPPRHAESPHLPDVCMSMSLCVCVCVSVCVCLLGKARDTPAQAIKGDRCQLEI